MDCSTKRFPILCISQSLVKLMSTESMMSSNHLILYRPLLLLPSIFPSIRVPSNESVLYIRWSKYWSFSFSTSPSNEYWGLTSFRIDWLDLCSPRDSQESSPTAQFKSINFQCSAFFMVQLSHPYVTTGKTIALNRFNSGTSLVAQMVKNLPVMWENQVQSLVGKIP